MHLMVENKGILPLSGIRLLGLSRKTPDQIGQFGTGLKEAIALLLRKGLELVIFSGDTKIIFGIHKVDDNDEVCFKSTLGSPTFAPNVWHGMGISPTFGKQDWTSAWQILREIFCNAIDEGITEYSFTNTLEGKLGHTRIYIQSTPEIEAEYSCLTKKLLPLSEKKPLYTIGKIKIFPPGENITIYCKGVFIQTGRAKSLFDYDIENLKLNESRSADWYAIHGIIGTTLQNNVDVLSTIISQAATTGWDCSFEKACFDTLWGPTTNLWKDAYAKAFGDAVAVKDMHQYEKVTKRGYKAIPFDDVMYTLLKKAGCPVCESVLNQDESEGIEIVTTASKTERSFLKIWAKLESKHLTRQKPAPKLKTYNLVGSKAEREMLGFYRDDTVYVHTKVVGSKQERHVLLEEIAHYVTGSGDASRDMQNYLIEVIDVIMGGN